MLSRQNLTAISSRWRAWVNKCADPGCSSQSVLRFVANRGHDLKLEDNQYCGPDCFERAVGTKINELVKSSAAQGKTRNSRVPLGLLLLSRGILTAEQIKVALDYQKGKGLNFGDAVQQLGFATPEQVTAGVAAQWACPVFSLGDRRLKVLTRIPRLLLECYGMLPAYFVEDERRLLIGFVHRVQHQVLYTIEHMTSCQVAPCFITARDYELQLNSLSTPFLRDDELVFEKILGTSETAGIIRNYAVQIGAERVRLGICQDYLWARIWTRNREMDLLFRVRHH